MKSPHAQYKPPTPDATPLPNGYKIFVASKSQMSLQDETGEIIAGSNVKQLGSAGDLIFGLVEECIAPEFSGTPGYFVLNSGEGDRNLIQGLSQEEWTKELRKRGLSKVPELVESHLKRPRGDW